MTSRPTASAAALPIGTLVLAATAALVAMALFSAASAMAESTALCSEDEAPCAKAHTITHVHDTSVGKATLLTSIMNVSCEVLFLGNTVEGTSTPLVVKGNFTYSGCGTCTVTEENGPAELNILKEGHETASVTGKGLVHVKCGFLINCNYIAEGLKWTAKGPLLSTQEHGEISITEQTVKKESGTCPATSKLDIKLTPSTSTYIASEPPPVEPKEEESLGRENLSSPNVTQCLASTTINCATGNLTEEQTDIPALGGRGPVLQVIRAYNSRLAVAQSESGPFGYGWTGPYSSTLSFSAGGAVATVRLEDGATATFNKKEGKYVAPSWNLSSLKESGESWIFTLPTQEQLEFNKSGQLIKVIDRHKNALTVNYKEGHLETVKSSAGRTLTFTFTEGHVTAIKDPLGHEVKYAYESGNLTKVTLPSETEPNWTFKYDGSHQLTEATDGRAHTTIIEYDASHRVKSQKDPLGRTTSLEYKETGGVRETTITEPNGSKTFEKLNAKDEPTETTKALGTAIAQTTKHKYNEAYAQTELTDANGHVTKYGYDGEGNRTSKKDPNENEVKWGYNSTHDVTSETTPGGEKTTITRNSSGDPETIKRPAPGEKTQETKKKWAENGDLEEETDPLGHVTKYGYDKYGDRESETDPEGDKRTWKYDEDGRVTAEVSPRGYETGKTTSEYETKIERDAQGRLETVTDPSGGETKDAYDANGNLKEQTNPNKHTTKYVFDADNEQIEVKAANGDVSKTAYDSEGDVESKTDGNNHTTKYEHNDLNELTKTTDPLGRETTQTYTAAGKLETVTDPKGRTTTYTYDAGDRLKEVKYSEEATKPVTYVYNADGDVTEMKDGTGTTKNTYDELDRLTESKNGNSEVVKYEYDLGNEITKITYPNGQSATRKFDAAGRLESVKDWLSKETKFSYYRDSTPSATTFPATTEDKDEYAYDKAGRIEATTMKRGATTLVSITYARGSAGQLKSATQSGLPGLEKPEYTYDERERMKEGAGKAFEYNAASEPTKLGSTTQTYDEASELSEAGTTKYGYDELGERIETKPGSGPATQYGYDQAHHLVSATRKEEGGFSKIEDTYAYDGNDLRASQTINGTTTHMVWNTTGNLPLLLYDGTNYYVYGPDGTPFEQIASETPTYLHHDQQGSTRLLTNSEGQSAGKYTYTPYGAVEEHAGAASTPLGYDGEYRSEDTGLIYLRARAYDPATAQFMSVDPLVEHTGAPYYYAGDSPTNASDPDGMAFGGLCGVWGISIPVLRAAGAACATSNLRQLALVASFGLSSGLTPPGIEAVGNWLLTNRASFNTAANAGIGAFASNAARAEDMRGPRKTTFFSISAFGYAYGYTRSRSDFGGESVIASVGAAAGVSFSATVGESTSWVVF